MRRGKLWLAYITIHIYLGQIQNTVESSMKNFIINYPTINPKKTGGREGNNYAPQ